MNRFFLACLFGMSGVCGCSQESGVLITAPPAIQQGLQLGVFKDLRATLKVGTLDNGGAQSIGPTTPVSGCPFGDEVALDADGSFHAQCTLQGNGMYLALMAYEEAGYIDPQHPDPLILVEKLRQVQVGNAGAAPVSFDDAATSTNAFDGDRYDSNHNGVSNLGDILQGWNPQATGLVSALKLEDVPPAANPGFGALFRLALLPPNGNQALLSLFGSSGAGNFGYIAIVDTRSPATSLWHTNSDFLPTIDAPRQRILMLKCDGTNPSNPCHLDSIGFSGSGYSSVTTHTWEQTYMGGGSAPAVEADGTTWIIVHDSQNQGLPALKRVSADGSSVSALLPISGVANGSCLFGPAFDNHWIINSTLRAFYQPNRDNCGLTTNDADVQMVTVSLGATPSAGPPLTLKGAGCSSGPPRVAIDSAGGAIYAATKNDLSAYTLDGTKKWTSVPVDLTAQHCGATTFTAQNTSVPLVTSSGDILVIFGGCEVFAYSSQGQPSVQQAAKWHREFGRTNPFNRGGPLGDYGLSESLGSGHLALAGAYFKDAGATVAGSGFNGNLDALSPPIGGITVDLSAASPERAAISGFFAQTPQYANRMSAQTAGQYQPKSDVVGFSGMIYFAMDVYNTPAAASQLTCVSPPCYYFVAGKNAPLQP
jgi:hypothetical protein